MRDNDWQIKNSNILSVRENELLKRSYETIMNNIVVDDSPWKPYRCIIPGKGFYGIWNWDTAFHSMAVSRWDTELAEEGILGFMQFQNENGMLPDVIRPDGSIEDRLTKPPVMPWSAELVYRRSGNKEFLKKLYPMFVKNEKWWKQNRYSGGLFFYSAEADEDSKEFDKLAGWETGWDNSVRWDFAKVSALWAIDLNCYMVMFYRAMSFFADELELKEEAKEWCEKEKELINAIEDTLWDKQAKCYVDVNRFTGEMSNVLTPASFMPLFIKTAPKERAEAMNELATDKNKFDFKMPTVSYDSPEYSRDYWRGPTWLNVAYFAAKGLKNYGFDSADKIKATILKWCDNEKRGILENYDSVTGEGLCCDCFSWSSAFIIEFILNL